MKHGDKIIPDDSEQPREIQRAIRKAFRLIRKLRLAKYGSDPVGDREAVEDVIDSLEAAHAAADDIGESIAEAEAEENERNYLPDNEDDDERTRGPRGGS